jgi:hypothetical protein
MKKSPNKEIFEVEKINCDCGAIYDEKRIKLPARDKDSSKCGFCGSVLRSWNGGVMYSHKLLTPPKEAKPK